MARDLKNFARRKGKNVDERIAREIPRDKQEQAQQIQEQISQYEGKSEDELFSALLSQVEQGKRDGSFTQEGLQSFIQSVSPMLTDGQRQKLGEIANKIR
ncbi:hypothetical protein AALG83_00675 [Christensenellaceae bacterium 44-20]|jgi:hypothetical protein